MALFLFLFTSHPGRRDCREHIIHLTLDVGVSQVRQDFGLFILPADGVGFFIKNFLFPWKILVWRAFGQAVFCTSAGPMAPITSTVCQSGECECWAQERREPGLGEPFHTHIFQRVVGRQPKAGSAWRSTSNHRTCLCSACSDTQLDQRMITQLSVHFWGGIPQLTQSQRGAIPLV